MKLIIAALDVIERRAHTLKEQMKKGKPPEWKDIRVMVKAVGAILEDPQFLAEVGKKAKWLPYVLNMIAGFIRSL